MNKHILVLTATGTTGRHTVAALLRAGARVRAGTRAPESADLPAGAEPVRWDYDAAETWGPALVGIDALYLALPPFRPDEAELGAAIVSAAKAAGVRRIVKLSAAGVEGNPESGHRRVELAVEASGLAWIHLRPNFFFENFVEFYGEGVRSAGVIALPAGQGRTSFLGAADIGEVAAKALLSDRSGEAWTLTGEESLTHDEVAATLAEVLGRRVRFVDVAPEDHVAAMRAWGMPPTAVATMDALYGFVRAGWTGEVSPTLAQELGRAPQRFGAWAAEQAAAWR